MAIFNGWLGYGTAINGYVITEPTDAGYARQPITLSDMNPSSPSMNEGSSAFGPAVNAWGTIACAGLFDAVTAGNCLLFWRLPNGHIINSGQSLITYSGDIRIAFSNVSAIVQVGSVSYQTGEDVGTFNGTSVVVAGILTDFQTS